MRPSGTVFACLMDIFSFMVTFIACVADLDSMFGFLFRFHSPKRLELDF